MRGLSRYGMSPAWFNSHRTDMAGFMLLGAVLLLLFLLVKAQGE